MDFRYHAHITGSALRDWLVAQFYDSLAVAALWFLALMILHTGVWVAACVAFVAAFFQFIPHFGPVLVLVTAGLAGLLTGGWERMMWVFIAYGVILVLDGLLLQPLFMRRKARVPFWAALFGPIAIGMIFSTFFGLGLLGALIAAPLLAVIFAYRARRRAPAEPEVEIIPPSRAPAHFDRNLRS